MGVCQLLLFFLLPLFLASLSFSLSQTLQPSQAQILLKIQAHLNFPFLLTNWNTKTNFCHLDPSPSVTIVCYGNNLTQLIIIGTEGLPKLPHHFSIDSLVTDLVQLPSLKVLTLSSLGLWGSLPPNIQQLPSIEMLNFSSNYLYGAIPKEMSSLQNLQGLILDHNIFSGQIPDIFASFPALNILSLRNNSLHGSLPTSFSKLSGLRVLALANNHFSGQVPDLRGSENLEELDLENNTLGPYFPHIGNKLLILVLRNNSFRSGIPDDISSYYQLEKIDISYNIFMGPLPLSLLSLPSINYLNIAENKFTGILSRNLSCSNALSFVDLSSNLLTGDLPECLDLNEKQQIIHYEGNCLNLQDQSQHAYSFCRNEALAAGIVPFRQKQNRARKAILALAIVGGALLTVVAVVLIIFLVRRVQAKKQQDSQEPRVIAEKGSVGYASKLHTDARYISQTMKLGAVGVPAYRTFSLEELEAATNNFGSTAFMGEGTHGQMYRGQLRDGSLVAIRCLKLQESCTAEDFIPHLELLSKLRHRHLVSAIGHCFEHYLEDSSLSRLFLVFEYVPNGTLRSWISAGRARKKLSWSQRIAASMGIAKGIEFLHTGIVPGIFSNNIRITDVLMDQNFSAKISSYNLPLLAENMGQVSHGKSSMYKEFYSREVEHEDKMDVYDFGVILLEILVGRPIKTRSELNVSRNQVEASLAGDDRARRSIVAEEIGSSCSEESVKTMIEICIRCLTKDAGTRPSIEDVLWNLQFAAQVQDAWQGGESLSSRSASISPPRLPRLRLTYQ